MLVYRHILPLLSLGLLALAGCEDGALRADRLQLLSDTTERVILPSYRAFDAKAEALQGAAAALLLAPSMTTLRGAQEAWRGARRPWKQSEAFLIGPGETLRISPAVDSTLVDGAQIEAAIAEAATLDVAYIEAAGAAKKGFLALEYLLFDPTAGDGAVLLALEGSERRRQYALAVAAHLRERSAALRAAWEGDFARELREAGAGSQTFTTQKQAIDALVNRLIYLIDKVATSRLGKPLGLMSGGVVQPAQEEARRSDNSIADIADNLRGALSLYRCSYEGLTGLGIADLVRRQSEPADARAKEILDGAIAAVERIPAPMRTTLLNNPQPIRDAYEKVQEARRTFATQIAGLLGVTLKFNDNDGD